MLVVAGVALVLVGVLGWQCMGPNTPAIITRALDGSAMGVTARALLVLYIVCTYPLAMFPAVEAAEAARTERKAPALRPEAPRDVTTGAATAAAPVPAAGAADTTSAEPDESAPEDGVERVPGCCDGALGRGGALEGWTVWGVLLRVGAVGLASGIALGVQDMSIVLALVGWVCLGGLSFIVPPVFRLQVDAAHRRAWERFTARHPTYRYRDGKDAAIVLGQTAEVDGEGRARVGVPPMSAWERRGHWAFLVVGALLCLGGAALTVVEHVRSGGKDAVHGA